MHRPQRLATSRRQPPPRTGCPSCTVTQARRRHAMVVAHFFESGQRRRLRWGRVESAPLMAGAVALASTGYIAAIDEKAWAGPRRLGRASRVPHSVSRHCHGDSSRAEYARRKVESSFWSGGWIAAQLRPPGTGCSPATVPLRSLDDWLVLRVINSFTAPVLL